jgi:hypothetical protein
VPEDALCYQTFTALLSNLYLTRPQYLPTTRCPSSPFPTYQPRGTGLFARIAGKKDITLTSFEEPAERSGVRERHALSLGPLLQAHP